MTDAWGDLNEAAGDMLAHALERKNDAERWAGYLEPVTKKMAELDLSDTVPACASCGARPAYLGGRCASCYVAESIARGERQGRHAAEQRAVMRKLWEEGKL